MQDRCVDVYIHDDDEFTMDTTDGIYHKLVAFQKEVSPQVNIKHGFSLYMRFLMNTATPTSLP
jgi:hypothetical protein